MKKRLVYALFAIASIFGVGVNIQILDMSIAGSSRVVAYTAGIS